MTIIVIIMIKILIIKFRVLNMLGTFSYHTAINYSRHYRFFYPIQTKFTKIQRQHFSNLHDKIIWIAIYLVS